MKFFTTFVILAGTVLSAVAVPTAEPVELVSRGNHTLETRETFTHSIFVCQGPNWNDGCVTVFPAWNTCFDWKSLNLAGLGSWGPSEGTWCIIYDGHCGSSDTPSNTFTFPGLAPVPEYWVYHTHSWKCWW